MNIIVAMYLFGLSLWVIWLMFKHHSDGTCDLLSIRNFALIGFILFQLTSAAVPLLFGDYGRFHINSPTSTSLIYSVMVTVFLIVMLWAYRHGWGCRSVISMLPLPRTIPSDASLILLAIIVGALGWVLRFAVNIPLVSILGSLVGVGLASVSAALVGWVWTRRLFNPAIALISIFVIVAGVLNVVTGAFGRRGLLAVGSAILWGMYYSHWRYIATPTLLRKIALASIIPVILLALFSSGRVSSEKERTPQEQIKAMLSADIKDGMVRLLGGQGCGTVSMWIVENYPEHFEYRNLLTLRYFFLTTIPRSWWPDKPLPLSSYIAHDAALPGVNKTVGAKSGGGRGGISIGPGIIGHAIADGGWPVLFLYAVLFGLFVRFFDEMIYASSYSPIIVLPVGAALGQIVGLSRGETSNFANNYVIAVVGCIIIMLFLNKVFCNLAGTQIIEDPNQEIMEYDEEDPYATEAYQD